MHAVKVFLAASFSRQAEMRRVRRRLKQQNIAVTAHWLEEHTCPSNMSVEQHRQAMAAIDLHDILKADVFVRFTDPQVQLEGEVGGTVPASLATGSRFFEQCYAYCNHKPIIVVGGHQCLYDYMAEVKHVRDVEEMVTFILEKKW